MEQPKLINNITERVVDDLRQRLSEQSRISIAAASFSIYAYEALKTELEKIDELRFIFTSPTFIKDKAKKEKREFYIPKLNRERNLYGTDFEIRLRNQLSQKAIAKECAERIRRKVKFRSNFSQEQMGGFLHVQGQDTSHVYLPFNEFTTTQIGCERGNEVYNIVNVLSSPTAEAYLSIFNEQWENTEKFSDVTDCVLEYIDTVYQENAPEYIYFLALYNIFNEFLEDISEDVLPNERTGFKNSVIWNKLYNFQKDAALAIINKLERYNGCILADSVGLGKTFTALAVVKYYENRNKSVLVLCPKKLNDNWQTFRANYKNNPIAADRLRYDILFHSDLSRDRGTSNGLDWEHINWGNYDLIVIDESHNFRNGGNIDDDEEEETGFKKENRYQRLMNKVIRSGVKTKVLMLSATPVNNRFNDLKNQLQLAYEGRTENIDDALDLDRNVDEVFRNAQTAYNKWAKLPSEQRTTEKLLSSLHFDFFQLLDAVTIARSRSHIVKYYDTKDIGEFPKRLVPLSRRPSLTNLDSAINFSDIAEQLNSLNLSLYTPSLYLFDSAKGTYSIDYEGEGLSIDGREKGLRKLMATNLLKRLESSVNSFRLTLTRISEYIRETIRVIDDYDDKHGSASVDAFGLVAESDFEYGDTDPFATKKSKISLADMDYVSWRRDLSADLERLELLLLMLKDITPMHDSKLQMLLADLKDKFEHPINGDNKKALIFTAFADTANYLYEQLADTIKNDCGLNTALITGSTEGQNLQDCDYLINYDIHWNPVRIIQRFGRIDRIGSKNKQIQLVNYWPDMELDDYIQLKGRVPRRMKVTILTAAGTGNPLSIGEEADLEYRLGQLKKLQNEVMDIEDMDTGINIMDLGLNEFRLDLLSYLKEHPDIEHAPFGLNAVVGNSSLAKPGVMFVLKNRNNSVNIDHKNLLHPFYMVYLSDDGEVICDHLHPKQLLDTMRVVCRDKKEYDHALCTAVNRETKDGRDMKHYSHLLHTAIDSIVTIKQESDIESLFSEGETTALSGEIKGLDDFELITFLIIK